jgi:hypothetical protein
MKTAGARPQRRRSLKACGNANLAAAKISIGQRMVLDDVGRTIIGVVPSSFHLRIQNFPARLAKKY